MSSTDGLKYVGYLTKTETIINPVNFISPGSNGRIQVVGSGAFGPAASAAINFTYAGALTNAGSLNYQLNNNVVTLQISIFNGTAVATSNLLIPASTLPLEARPISPYCFAVQLNVNGTIQFGTIIVRPDGSIEFYADQANSAFTISQTLEANCTITVHYPATGFTAL